MPSVPPPTARHSDDRMGLRWNWWNLLLLVPLLVLITPWFNRDHPRLFGLPFFYWYQFAYIPVGVICVGVVYLKTRPEPARNGDPGHLPASGPGVPAAGEDPDEGNKR